MRSTLRGLPASSFVKDEEARRRWFTDVAGGPDPESPIGRTGLDPVGDEDEEHARWSYEGYCEVIATGR